MKKLAIIFLVFSMSFTAQADDAAKRQLVERLLKVMDADAMIQSMYGQMDKMVAGMGQRMGIKPSEQVHFNRYMKKVTQAMKTEMTWAKMKEPMIAVYIKHYTEKEMKDLLVFYSSDTGKSIIKKMPLVMRDSIVISQQMFRSFLPKLQALAVELQNDIKKERSKK